VAVYDISHDELRTRLRHIKTGGTFNGRRDIYAALSYPDQITFEEMYERFERQDIAKAIIQRPVKATWSGLLDVFETSEEEDTELEKEWARLSQALNFKTEFERVDMLASIGDFAIIFLGYSDVTSLAQYSQPVRKRDGLKLVYLRSFAINAIQITQFDTNIYSPRFGLPEIYTIQFAAGDNASVPSQSIEVHHSRVIHVMQNNLVSNYRGIPILKSVYNRLIDLEKLVGGSAEMFWRGARPGYQGVLKDDYMLSEKSKAELEVQLDEYENDLRRFLILDGVEISNLETQVSDPANHILAQIQMISADTGIPMRILLGSEKGELASTQDRDSWFDFIDNRRTEYAEPRILKPFIDRLIETGILPAPKDEVERYKVIWPVLYKVSDKDKAEIGRTRATAIQQYGTSPFSAAILPVRAFYRYCMGMSDDDIEYTESLSQTELEKEITELQLEAMVPPQPAQGGDSGSNTKPKSRKSSGKMKTQRRPNAGGV
jgi:hypothetical protein